MVKEEKESFFEKNMKQHPEKGDWKKFVEAMNAQPAVKTSSTQALAPAGNPAT